MGIPQQEAAPRALRSMLFVPADDERKLAKAARSAADALILDLEDSVLPHRKSMARSLAAEFLRNKPAAGPSFWVRVNALHTAQCRADVACAVDGGAEGVVLPKIESHHDIATLTHWLDDLERDRRPENPMLILPITTETPRGALALASSAEHSPRVAALTWGAEDLSAALGATTNVDDGGRWLPPYELARSLCLLAAAAARVPAIDTVYTTLHDAAGLERFAARARRDGFSGALAIHPEQIAVLNETFAPTVNEIREAERVVASFAQERESGVVSLDGRMLDRPHLERSKRLLAAAATIAERVRAR